MAKEVTIIIDNKTYKSTKDGEHVAGCKECVFDTRCGYDYGLCEVVQAEGCHFEEIKPNDMKANTIKRNGVYMDVCYLQLNAVVEYAEDAEVNGEEDAQEDGNGNIVIKMPFLEKSDSNNYPQEYIWHPLINVETGFIENWPKGTKAATSYKVCDQCNFKVLDGERNEIASYEGYVPAILDPDEESFGDYLLFNIEEDGMITSWFSDSVELKRVIKELVEEIDSNTHCHWTN